MNKQDYIKLVDLAKLHNHLYYVESAPIISDGQFDRIMLQLRDHEAIHPEDVLPDSPTQCVGSDLNGNGRALVTHRTPMLSQQKAHTIQEVQQWQDVCESKIDPVLCTSPRHFFCSWKYDGISCSLVYIDGSLVSAATRGDGSKGQDIMQHVSAMPSIPQQLKWGGIDCKGRIEVRGEIVCPKGQHAALGYKDERTAASAICNASYSDSAKSLVFYPWEVFFNSSRSCNPAVWHLDKMGFKETISWEISTLSPDFLADREKERAALDFPVDGLVFKVSNSRYFDAMGANKHHPHGSIAYKFAAETATTTVERIEVKVAASGKRTPVAHISPVVIMGRTINRVNLYSERTMQSFGVTEGCTAVVALQNDVTPKIVSVEGFKAEPVKPSQKEEETHTSDFSYLPANFFAETGNIDEEPAKKSPRSMAVAVCLLVLCVGVCTVCAAGLGSMFFAAPLLAGAFKM